MFYFVEMSTKNKYYSCSLKPSPLVQIKKIFQIWIKVTQREKENQRNSNNIRKKILRKHLYWKKSEKLSQAKSFCTSKNYPKFKTKY